MTFEEWWQQYVKPAHFYTVEQTAKAAWDYQQQRIDKLGHKLEVRDAFITGLQFHKPQDQELLAKLNPKEYGDDEH